MNREKEEIRGSKKGRIRSKLGTILRDRGVKGILTFFFFFQRKQFGEGKKKKTKSKRKVSGSRETKNSLLNSRFTKTKIS